jgi:hypothetical protein
MSELRDKHPELAALVKMLEKRGFKPRLSALIERDGTEHGAVTEQMRETAREAWKDEA